MASSTTAPRVLTSKGLAASNRILDAAAELFYERGVSKTTNDEIRAAAGVSGSQLNHYFATRADLVDAVLQRRIADAIEPLRFPDSGMPHSFATLRSWADTYLERYQTLTGGCRVGSLASELLKSSPQLRARIDEGLERWRQALRAGLDHMKETGELSDRADTDYLSAVVLSALQGGLLLTQASGSTKALQAALDGAIEVVGHYASPPGS